MTRRAVPSRRAGQAGFSLVELMVASALGLLVTLVVTGSILTMGRQLSVTGANAAAQGSAQVALSLIDAAGRSAGAGFYNAGQPICPTWNAYNGSTVVADGDVFMPAQIVSGGAGTASDTVIFTGGQGTRTLVATPLMEDAPGHSLKVSDAGDWAQGDLAVLGAPGSSLPCTLIQVTQAPSVTSACDGNAATCKLLVRGPNEGLNPNPTEFGNTPRFGFETSGATTGPAVVSRVGAASAGFRRHAFTVQCNTLVRYDAFQAATPPACTASPLAFGSGVDAIAPEVVLMHAQYGVSDTPASDVVTAWVEPSGTPWGAPGAADVGRIKALRIVLVARSREADASEVTAPCTNAAGVANTGPCSFQDAAAPVIDLSAVPTAAGRGWRNYRYRVQRAVIPLANVIWSSS